MVETPRVQAGMRVGLAFEFQHKAIIREVIAVFYPLEGESDEKVPLTLTSDDATGGLEHDSSTDVYRAVVRGHVRGDHAPGRYVCGFVGAKTAGEHDLRVSMADLPRAAFEVIPEPDEEMFLTNARYDL